jgi:CBS domain-containing protein
VSTVQEHARRRQRSGRRLERFMLAPDCGGDMDVRELMTTPVHTLTVDDTLNQAAKLMRDRAIGCVPIVDRDGRLVGILTDRDIAVAAHTSGKALWGLPTVKAMHAPVQTCGPLDGVEVAAGIMRRHGVHRLPVVDEQQRPLGIVSLDDLAHASRQPLLEPEPGLTSDEVDDTYEAVRRHLHGPKEVP